MATSIRECLRNGCTEPRYVNPKGRIHQYCIDHKREYYRDYYAQKGTGVSTAKQSTALVVQPANTPAVLMCVKCGVKPRHKWRGGLGKQITLCIDCYRAYDSEKRAQRRRLATQGKSAVTQATDPGEPHRFGLLAKSAMLLDQTADAIHDGEADGIQIQLVVGGVAYTMSAQARGKPHAEE